jgi:hypothetical protein
MQIHEITNSKSVNLDEGVMDTVGAGIGRTVSGAKNVASFVASPFKDVAQGYKTARTDQQTAAMADKAQRAWQQYSVSWAKSQGGTYTPPGKAPAAGTTAGSTPGAAQSSKAPAAAATVQDLFGTIQALDDTQLAAVAKILKQRVGPKATMNALKTTPVDEVSYQDIRSGVQRAASGVANVAKAAYGRAAPVVKQAATAGVQAVKAAPGAIARAAGGTAGSIAGMPGAASTAYRGAKARTAGPAMTPAELQRALVALSVPEAQELYSFVTQIQQARKAGLREGLSQGLDLNAYKEALRSFVQQNLLAGKQYSRLLNVQDIETLVTQLVDPANDTVAKQKELWQKLVLAAAVSRQRGAAAPGTSDTDGDSTKSAGPATGTEDAESLEPTVKTTLNKVAPEGTLNAIGSIVRQGFTQNNATVKSTGVPGVDALLMAMKFNVQ